METTPKRLVEADYIKAATLLRTGVAEVKAVAHVESRGRGFLADGRLVIRFEGHKFRKYTGGQYDRSHPTISHPYMAKCPYNRGVIGDYVRLKTAMALNPNAAMLSCSWGLFQIMGDECWRCGFGQGEVGKFVDFLKTGEAAHLTAFCKFLASKNLDGHLRAHNWAKLSYGYNGANYKDNDYDGQMARAYAYFSQF